MCSNTYNYYLDPRQPVSMTILPFMKASNALGSQEKKSQQSFVAQLCIIKPDKIIKLVLFSPRFFFLKAHNVSLVAHVTFALKNRKKIFSLRQRSSWSSFKEKFDNNFRGSPLFPPPEAFEIRASNYSRRKRGGGATTVDRGGGHGFGTVSTLKNKIRK